MKQWVGKIITPENRRELQDYIQKGPSGAAEVEADVLVIGSGPGGSTAASQLAAAGLKVIVAEEGANRTAPDFHTDEYRSMVSLFRDRGFINAEMMAISILQGRTVGGSTTVNWQASLYPSEHTTARWRDDYGLPGYGEEEMTQYLKEVEKTLGLVTLPESLVNVNNHLLRKGAQKLGYQVERIKNNNGGSCIGLGRCTMGCPIDAKRTSALTYLSMAIDSGAIVLSEMRAEKIFEEKNGYSTVLLDTPSDELNQRGGPAIYETIKVHSRAVVVSAGAIETPALLLKSGMGNSWVGRDLKLHPTASQLARYEHPVKSWEGPPQTVAIFDQNTQNGHKFWIEAAPYGTTLLSLVSLFHGDIQANWLKNAPNLAAGIVLVAENPASETAARVEVTGAGQKKVFFDLRPEDAKQALTGIRMLAKIQAASGAKEIAFPFTRFKSPLQVTPQDDFEWILNEKTSVYALNLGSAHPHGSVKAAADPSLGALNPDLELYGHKNLYVMDASWFPTSLGVNPQITVTASILKAAGALAQKLTS